MGTLNPRVIEELRSLQTEGSSGFVAELIDLFTKEAVQHLSNLRAGVERRDATLVERSAHTLKGSSGNLGAEGLSRLAAQLQTLARTPDWDRIAALVGDLEREWVLVEADLRSERDRP